MENQSKENEMRKCGHLWQEMESGGDSLGYRNRCHCENEKKVAHEDMEVEWLGFDWVPMVSGELRKD